MQIQKNRPFAAGLHPKTLGIILTAAGSAIIICIVLIWILAPEFVTGSVNSKPDIEFEEGQTSSDYIAESDTISIPGFETMEIPAGERNVSTHLYNPEGNTCYFEISIILTDTNEEIYKSKFIAPGQELFNIELNRSLEEGTYDAYLHYNTYSINDYTELNGANAPFKLIVE